MFNNLVGGVASQYSRSSSADSIYDEAILSKNERAFIKKQRSKSSNIGRREAGRRQKKEPGWYLHYF